MHSLPPSVKNVYDYERHYGHNAMAIEALRQVWDRKSADPYRTTGLPVTAFDLNFDVSLSGAIRAEIGKWIDALGNNRWLIRMSNQSQRCLVNLRVGSPT